MPEIKSLAEFGFNPMASVNTAINIQQLQQQGQMMGLRELEMGVHQQNAKTAQIQAETAAKKERSDSLIKTLTDADKIGLSPTEWFDAQNELMKMNTGKSLDPTKAQEAIAGGKEIYRVIGEFRTSNPDAPLPPEIQGMLKGYLNRYGVMGERSIRDVTESERGITVNQALHGDVDAMAVLANKDSKLMEKLVDKEFMSPKDNAQIEHIGRENARIDAETTRLQASAGAILAQGELTRNKVKEYESYVEPMNQLKLLEQEGKNDAAKIALEAATQKNQNFKAFRESIPKRKQELLDQQIPLKSQEYELSILKDAVDMNLIPQAELQGRMKNLGVTPDTIDGKLAQLRAQIEDGEREQQYLDAPTPENFQIFKAGEENRRKELFKKAADLKTQKEELQAASTTLKRTQNQEGQFKLQQAKGLIQAGNLAADRATELGVEPHLLSVKDIKDIAAKSGIGYTELKKVLNETAKDPNRPGVEVKVNMPGSTDEAGKFTMISNALGEISKVKEALIKPDGSIDRGLVFSSAWNLPFSKGRNISAMIDDALSAKLRSETGAAATEDEREDMRKRYKPNTLDADQTIKDKMDRLEKFLKEARLVRDPTGMIRDVASGTVIYDPKGKPKPGPNASKKDAQIPEHAAPKTAEEYLKKRGYTE